MLEFHAVDFVNAFSKLQTWEGVMRLWENPVPGSEVKEDPDGERLAVGLINDLESHCRKLPLPDGIFRQISRLRGKVAGSSADPRKAKELRERCWELRSDLSSDLKVHLFYAVPASESSLMTDPEPFGSVVGAKFSTAAVDIRSAGQCLALDQWTGSVFHCMRVLEHGLRVLAVEAGLSMTATVELENWKNIIDRIEKAVRDLEGTPRTPERVEKQKRLSTAASQFRYFRDAWRNHVAHSRESYDKTEAQRVWTHTKEFMEGLATWVA
jgi:hypothetical protein